jgi:hypothetical protein
MCMKMVGHVARMGRLEIHTKVLVGKPEGMSPSGRYIRWWEDNIKKALKKCELVSSVSSEFER